MSRERYISYPRDLRAKQKSEGCSLFCIGVLTPQHEISCVGPCSYKEAAEIVEFLRRLNTRKQKQKKK